jgi:hypothetical protein
MALPIELHNMKAEAALSTDQVRALVTWYFSEYLNKEVKNITSFSGQSTFGLDVVFVEKASIQPVIPKAQKTDSSIDLD